MYKPIIIILFLLSASSCSYYRYAQEPKTYSHHQVNNRIEVKMNGLEKDFDRYVKPYDEEHLVKEKTGNWEYCQINERRLNRDYYSKEGFEKSCRIWYNAFMQVSYIKIVYKDLKCDEIYYKYKNTILSGRKIYRSNGEVIYEKYEYGMDGSIAKKEVYKITEDGEEYLFTLEYSY